MDLLKQIKDYSYQYHQLMTDPELASKRCMPGDTFFIKDNHILSIPREDGDNRYPFGHDGFNFWAYASGYMHANEGLFSPYLRALEGQEPKIAFFAGIYDKINQHKVISLLSVPIIETDSNIVRYTVFTPCSVYYLTEVDELIFAIRVFVTQEKTLCFTTLVQNNSIEKCKVFISSYFNPFLKNAVMEGTENRWFRQASVISANGDQNLDSFLLEVYEEKDRGLMAPNYGVFTRNMELSKGAKILNVQNTTSRSDYVGGVRSSLHTPKALKEGKLNNKLVTTFTDIGVAADLIHLDLSGGAYSRLDTLMDCCYVKKDKDLLINKQPSGKKIDELETVMTQIDKEKQNKLKIVVGKSLVEDIKEEVFESFFEHLKKQVEFCSLIKGYIQLSNFSLIGIRDILQALEGLIYWEPKIAREKMLEVLSFIAPNGRCPRQYSLPSYGGESPNMDLRPFIDQGMWVISTLSTYFKLTHDFQLLDEVCGYYEIIDEKTHYAIKSEEKDSVLEHMFKIMDYLLINRDHEHTKCVLALYGDWNDALDGLGTTSKPGKKYGSGVSVMATLQLYQNCQEMIELLEVIGKECYQEKISEYMKVRNELREGLEKFALVTNDVGQKRIIHGWGDEYSYLVGSFNDPDFRARDGITSNAFWILSGMYDKKDLQVKNMILDAYDRLGSKYGLKTFEPAFEKGTKGVGRIPNLPSGTAENGATYTHASAFGVMSLFQMGESKKAWQELIAILPFTHENISVSPYVMPNSYGYNQELQIDGQSMQDWQTGSSNVVLKAIIRFVFGINPEYKGVWIAPAKDMPFESMKVKITVQNIDLFLEYKNTKNEQRIFMVNGKLVEGVYDPIREIQKLWLDHNLIMKNNKLYICMID